MLCSSSGRLSRDSGRSDRAAAVFEEGDLIEGAKWGKGRRLPETDRRLGGDSSLEDLSSSSSDRFPLLLVDDDAGDTERCEVGEGDLRFLGRSSLIAQSEWSSFRLGERRRRSLGIVILEDRFWHARLYVWKRRFLGVSME